MVIKDNSKKIDIKVHPNEFAVIVPSDKKLEKSRDIILQKK